jgi:catabolite regulation protein CreA
MNDIKSKEITLVRVIDDDGKVLLYLLFESRIVFTGSARCERPNTS